MVAMGGKEDGFTCIAVVPVASLLTVSFKAAESGGRPLRELTKTL